MSVVVPNAMVLSAIREKLEAIPGVDRVIAEGESVWLVCRSPLASAGILEKAQSVVRTSTAEGEPVRLEVVARADEIDRERVRFEGVERIEEADMRVRVRVALEWKGDLILGEATGEKGSNIELRTAALAALDAIDSVSDRPVGVRLAGVKQVRAFDAELMVVSLYQSGPGLQKYLGVALVGDDAYRAAALAVLHALNRVLGNFLVTR